MIAKATIETIKVSKDNVKDQITEIWTRTPRTELRKLVAHLRAKRLDLVRMTMAYASATNESRKAFAASIREIKTEERALVAEIKAGRKGSKYKGVKLFQAMQGATSAARTLTRSERRDLRELVEEVAASNGVTLEVQLSLAA